MKLFERSLGSCCVVPLLAALSATTVAFVPKTATTTLARKWGTVAPATIARLRLHLDGSLIGSTPSTATDTETDTATTTTSIRAPLQFIGPYPCLALRFPSLATSAQRSRNVTGISLDFVLDTAANTNTINGQVAGELGLDVVGSAPPGYGAGGAIGGAETFLLGDCQLEGVVAPPPEVLERNETTFTFMTGLTASALPVASPAAAGLLSSAFFNSFPGGVEFSWGTAEEDGEVPYVAFHTERPLAGDLPGKGVEIRQLPGTGLPSVAIRVNGVEIPALLDTGSPVTVLNGEAARLAGVKTIERDYSEKNGGGRGSMKPFARIANGFKTAQANSRGDVLAIAGATGERVELVRSEDEVDVGVGDDANTFGRSRIFVGDLPGLSALGGLGGASAPPAAVLGMDVLRRRSKMFYMPGEVYF